MVCRYLQPKEVAVVRFMSRTIADVGLEYLVRRFRLQFHQKSFDRLLELSRHPILRHHVEALMVCCDGLRDVNRMTWESELIGPEYLAYHQKTSMNDIELDEDALAWHVFFQIPGNCNRRNKFSDGELDQGYAVYQKYLVKQNKVCQKALDILTEAMVHLPRLSVVRLKQMSDHNNPWFSYLHELVKSLGVHCRHPIRMPVVLNMTQAALLAVDRAWEEHMSRQCQGSRHIQSRPRIVELAIDLLEWELLLRDKDVFTAIKRVFSRLLYLDVNAAHQYRTHTRDAQGKKQLHELLTAASDLEFLGIHFMAYSNIWSMDLLDLTGTFCWSSLKHFGAANIYVDEDDLVSFCDRHCLTLNKLSLGEIHLETRQVTGISWPRTFDRIRKTVKLKSVNCFGTFYSDAKWEMDRDTRNMIEDYLVRYDGDDDFETFQNSTQRIHAH